MPLDKPETWIIFLGFFVFGIVAGIGLGAYLNNRATDSLIEAAEKITMEAGNV
jgi:hypothetical protein